MYTQSQIGHKSLISLGIEKEWGLSSDFYASVEQKHGVTKKNIGYLLISIFSCGMSWGLAHSYTFSGVINHSNLAKPFALKLQHGHI